MFGLSGWEIVGLIGKRLPDIMRGLGSSARAFKKGMTEEAAAAPPPAAKPPTI